MTSDVSYCSKVISPENTPGGVKEIYTQWAVTYDEDVAKKYEYHGPRLVAEATRGVLGDRKHARVIDLGAGTGLVGLELQKLGFKNLDALDANDQMLAEAQKKKIYHNTFCDYLGPNKLQIENTTYDAATLCGTFVPNHANDSCFEEVIRILKPGDPIT